MYIISIFHRFTIKAVKSNWGLKMYCSLDYDSNLVFNSQTQLFQSFSSILSFASIVLMFILVNKNKIVFYLCVGAIEKKNTV